MNEGCLVMMLDIFRAHYSVLLASITRLEFIMERLALLAPILMPDTTLQTLTDRGGDTIRDTEETWGCSPNTQVLWKHF